MDTEHTVHAAAHESYLTTDVFTATPQKLHLMLIEGALRAVRRGRQKWEEGDHAKAGELLTHAQDIVGELLAGLNRDGATEIVQKLSAVYVFILRQLAEATLQRDTAKLDEAVRVLEIEHETWRQVCQRYGSRVEEEKVAAAPSSALPIDAESSPAGGFSIEA